MSGMQVQPLLPWRSTLPWGDPSFGFGQSTTAARSVTLAGPALRAFSIFHSSECADVVNVPGGRGALAVERSSAQAADEIAARPIAPYRALLVMTASIAPPYCGTSNFFVESPQLRSRRASICPRPGTASPLVIASARDNLGHKSNRKPAPVHGRPDNPLCNLSMWFLKARRHRTTINPNRRPTTCCQGGYFYYPSS
jgi:hypothetical protein